MVEAQTKRNKQNQDDKKPNDPPPPPPQLNKNQKTELPKDLSPVL